MNEFGKVATLALATSVCTFCTVSAGIAFAGYQSVILSLPPRGGLVDTGVTVTKSQAGFVTYQDSNRTACQFQTVYTLANITGVWINQTTGARFYSFGSFNYSTNSGSGYLRISGGSSRATLPAGSYKIYANGGGCYYNSSQSYVQYSY